MAILFLSLPKSLVSYCEDEIVFVFLRNTSRDSHNSLYCINDYVLELNLISLVLKSIKTDNDFQFI